jgi:hypothetical protein
VWFALYGGGLVRADFDRSAPPPPRDPTSLEVFPNPYIAQEEATPAVTFNNLRTGSSVWLYTLLGESVRQLTPADGDTSVVWDTRNAHGEEVASGVYFFVVRERNVDYDRGKLAIVR